MKALARALSPYRVRLEASTIGLVTLQSFVTHTCVSSLMLLLKFVGLFLDVCTEELLNSVGVLVVRVSNLDLAA